MHACILTCTAFRRHCRSRSWSRNSRSSSSLVVAFIVVAVAVAAAAAQPTLAFGPIHHVRRAHPHALPHSCGLRVGPCVGRCAQLAKSRAVVAFSVRPPSSRETTVKELKWTAGRCGASRLRPFYAIIRRSSSSSIDVEDDEDDNDNGTKNQVEAAVASILNASLLIAGTALGGGFLALPTVVAPLGFRSAAYAMIAVWLYFLLGSFVVAECLCRARTEMMVGAGDPDGSNSDGGDANCRGNDGVCGDADMNNDGCSGDDDSSHPGIAAAAQSAFGAPGEALAAFLLVVLTEATLVSQISRAGGLFPPSQYRFGCVLSALLVAAAVFGPRRGLNVASNVNALLTVLFLASAGCVFAVGKNAADWSRLVASSSSALAVATSTFLPGVSSWSTLMRAVPTFLQLLVYGEILPSVCRLLRYRIRPIRIAIALGSSVPLAMQLGWAALGIALIPSPDVVAVAGGALAGGDPVETLLEAGGPVRLPLFVLALTAILTTIVGSYLALQSTFDDVFHGEAAVATRKRGSSPSQPPPRSRKGDSPSSLSWRRRLAAASFIVAPATAIALVSPSVFLRAIDFAGSYPVLLLWGVFPPAIALMQRRHRVSKENGVERGRGVGSGAGPAGWLISMIILSLGLIGMSAIDDFTWLKNVAQNILARSPQT